MNCELCQDSGFLGDPLTAEEPCSNCDAYDANCRRTKEEIERDARAQRRALIETCEHAHREIATWPEWKQKLVRSW